MARGSRQRDTTDIASSRSDTVARLLRVDRPAPIVSVSRPANLRFGEDRRTFDYNPPVARARTVVGTPARIRPFEMVRPPVIKSTPGVRRAVKVPSVSRAPMRRVSWQFDRPDRVMVCVRRKIRREVLIAKGLSGGGRRKLGPYSDVRC